MIVDKVEVKKEVPKKKEPIVVVEVKVRLILNQLSAKFFKS